MDKPKFPNPRRIVEGFLPPSSISDIMSNYRIKKEVPHESTSPHYYAEKRYLGLFWLPVFTYWPGPQRYVKSDHLRYEDALDDIKTVIERAKIQYFYFDEKDKEDFRHLFNHENKNTPSGPRPLNFKKSNE